MSAIHDSVSVNGIVQFTRFPYDYPMHTPGFSSVGRTPDHQLVYTFTIRTQALVFLSNMQKWWTLLEQHFQGISLDAREYRPFAKEDVFFPAAPEVVACEVIVIFPKLPQEIQELAPYMISQMIGVLGSMEKRETRRGLPALSIPDNLSAPFLDLPPPPRLQRQLKDS